MSIKWYIVLSSKEEYNLIVVTKIIYEEGRVMETQYVYLMEYSSETEWQKTAVVTKMT